MSQSPLPDELPDNVEAVSESQKLALKYAQRYAAIEQELLELQQRENSSNGEVPDDLAVAALTPESDATELHFDVNIPTPNDFGFVGFINSIAKIEGIMKDSTGDDVPLAAIPLLVEFVASCVVAPTRADQLALVNRCSLPQLFDAFVMLRDYNGDEKKG